MLNYSNLCYDHFRMAKIRLIPKKGDLRNLKNWRPISLLSCFYKVLSRVVANRLRKYMDKLTPIGQKGFSESRQCQEPLINLSDIISKCNTQNLKACVLSLDISKAFDSISHSYLEQVLNFGPKFMKWIKLIATNRIACIIKGDGGLSRNFRLCRGNAQGDVISPFLFNLCFQILIFKFEFDEQVQSVDLEERHQRPRVLAAGGREVEAREDAPLPAAVDLAQEVRPPQPPPHPDPRAQRGRQVEQNYPFSKKIFAYADDGTLVLSLDYTTLSNVRTILDDFAIFSGLKCNIDKTYLMQIGSRDPISQEILNLGFSIATEITVLGMKFSGPGEDFIENNVAILKNKVEQQVNFWQRFDLSLPGRINIAKS